MSRLYYPDDRFEELPATTPAQADLPQAAEKVAKLIPAELVTGYGALVAACMTLRTEAWRMPAFMVCFLACLILTPLYLSKLAEPGRPKRNHLVVSTLAFPVWAYVISGNQVLPQYYDPALATITVVLFSLASGLVPMDR